MSYTAIEKVRHSGKKYEPGDTVPGLKKDEAKRLIDLGVIEEVEDTKADAKDSDKGDGSSKE